jgi:hypothetical protein
MLALYPMGILEPIIFLHPEHSFKWHANKCVFLYMRMFTLCVVVCWLSCLAYAEFVNGGPDLP